MTIEKTSIRKIDSLVIYIKKSGSKWWGMLCLSSLPFLIILAPILFGHRIFLKSDLVSWIYPIYHFYQSSLAVGESILWNPNNFSGFPSFIGSMGFLSPLHYLLFQCLPLFTAYNLIVFLNVFLGLFFTWRLLEKFGLPLWAGFIGGLVYVFSQWSLVPNITISNALPILPLLFLILWRIKEKGSNWFILWGGLLIGYSWLSVHFNWTIMTLSAAFLFSLFLAWLGSDPRQGLTLMIKFFLMVLIGTSIGLVIILPLLTYTDLSARSAGLSYHEVAIGSLNPGDFLRYLLPYFQVSIFNLAASPAQLYLGILPLFFLIFAFRFRSSLIYFFSFLFFLCLLISISYSPLFWLLHQCPIFNSFREPYRWMFIGSFAAAVLVGFGLKYFFTQHQKKAFDEVGGINRSVAVGGSIPPISDTFGAGFTEESERWKKLLLKIFKWIGLIILFISITSSLIFYFFKDKLIFLAQNYFDQYLYGRTSGLPIEHYHKFIEGTFSEIEQLFNIINPKIFLPIIFIFISCFILSSFCQKRLKTEHFPLIITLVILFNFLLIFSLDYPTISRKDFSRQPETVKFLQESLQESKPDQPRRIFSFLPGFSEYNQLTVPYQPKGNETFIFQSEMLVPNLNLLYGLESVDYYDNLMSRPMTRILALIGSDRATIGERLADLKITPEEKVKKLEERKKLLNLLGVRYIISVFPLDEEIFPQIFKTYIRPYNIPLSIYENREARPLFYFADHRVKVIEPDEKKAYEKLLEEPLEDRSIFIECLSCPADLKVSGQGEITLVKKANNFIQLETQSESPQWLVFSENYLPGWQAYLDNNQTPIYKVNTVYMGISMPAGQHQILFRYNI